MYRTPLWSTRIACGFAVMDCAGGLSVAVFGAGRHGLLIAHALLHLRDRGAVTHHLLDHLALVRAHGHAPLGLGAGLVLVAHGLVVREATGVHQHAEARTHAPGPAILDRDDAGDGAVLDDEFADRRFGANLDALFEDCLQHAALQRGAAGDPMPCPSASAPMARKADLGRQELGLPGDLEQLQFHDVLEHRGQQENSWAAAWLSRRRARSHRTARRRPCGPAPSRPAARRSSPASRRRASI